MLHFCIHSLFREYGWQFVRHVAALHPVKTVKAVFDSGRHDYSGEMITTSGEETGRLFGGRRSVVGVGFCLKPLHPPCPSGRANHDCLYLERLLRSANPDPPASCRQCAIREIGIATLKAGAAFYIMTSARDILFDMFAPSLDTGRFSSGLFVLCRYSLQPFAVGLLASGIQGWMFPFDQGDCANYKTWLQADRGFKDEQTTVGPQNRHRIMDILGRSVAPDPDTHWRYIRWGNILWPEP